MFLRLTCDLLATRGVASILSEQAVLQHETLVTFFRSTVHTRQPCLPKLRSEHLNPPVIQKSSAISSHVKCNEHARAMILPSLMNFRIHLWRCKNWMDSSAGKRSTNRNPPPGPKPARRCRCKSRHTGTVCTRQPQKASDKEDLSYNFIALR